MATIAAAASLQCRHKQRNYTLMKTTGSPFRPQYSMHSSIPCGRTLCHLSQPAVSRMKEQISYSELLFALCEGKASRTHTACNEADTVREANKSINSPILLLAKLMLSRMRIFFFNGSWWVKP